MKEAAQANASYAAQGDAEIESLRIENALKDEQNAQLESEKKTLEDKIAAME